MPGAALLSAFGSFGQSLFNNAMTEKNMRLQNQYAIRNWNMQNAYNSPKEQMSRLKSAGLNPNLIYQSGGTFTPADSISTPNAQYAPMSGLPEAIGYGIQADSVEAEIAKKKAETENINEDTITKGITNKYLPRQFRLQLRGLALNNSQVNANINLLESQRNYYSELTGLTSQQMKNASLEYPRTLAEIQNLYDQHQINGYEMKRLQSVIKNIDQNTDLLSKQAQQAWLNNSLLWIRLQAQKSDRNEFTLALDKMEEEIERLHWTNDDLYKSNELAPRGFGDMIFKIGNQSKFDFENRFGGLNSRKRYK